MGRCVGRKRTAVGIGSMITRVWAGDGSGHATDATRPHNARRLTTTPPCMLPIPTGTPGTLYLSLLGETCIPLREITHRIFYTLEFLLTLLDGARQGRERFSLYVCNVTTLCPPATSILRILSLARTCWLVICSLRCRSCCRPTWLRWVVSTSTGFYSSTCRSTWSVLRVSGLHAFVLVLVALLEW